MGLFNRFKKNSEQQTWKVYQDMLGDKKLSVRVDTQYVHMNYANTFYIQIQYSEQETVELPDRKFLENLVILEEKILEIVNETFENNIVFLGTATFGGSSYMTFASDLDVRWNDFIHSTIDKDMITGIYPNDNMGYYHTILYPDFMRK